MENKELLEQLKQEAKDLGIEFSANIGAEKLQAKIDAYYQAQETSGAELRDKINNDKQDESKEEYTVTSGSKTMMEIAKELYEQAAKTRVVTIIDNDQRVNNQTTTCKANWSNMYFDMGTRIFPLNTPIEIPQGFIDVLKEVKIPHHVKDSKTGLATTVMRSRYTISYEDIK